MESLHSNSKITLFSGRLCAHSHRVRLMLAEKNVRVSVKAFDHNCSNEELYAVNPYGELPIMIDRGVALYRANVIMEYLEERYPHPRLLPLDPLERGRARILMFRIENDWYRAMDALDFRGDNVKPDARSVLRDGLTAISPLFQQQPYMLGDNYSMVDCALLPILWRLPLYGVELPKSATPIMDYASRVFQRDACQTSLTPDERALYDS